MDPRQPRASIIAALLRKTNGGNLIPPEAEFELPEMIDPNDETLDTKEISDQRFIALGKPDSPDGSPAHEGAESPEYEATEADDGTELPHGRMTQASQIRRVMTQRPDGSWVFFEANMGRPVGSAGMKDPTTTPAGRYGRGERPAGASVADLLRRGFVPTSNEEFTRANQEAYPAQFAQRNMRRIADGAPTDEMGAEDDILEQLLSAPKAAANSIAALLRRKPEGM